MSEYIESIIDQDWSNLAVDDGIVDEFNDFYAKIHPRAGVGGDVLTSRIENISYSPELNTAKSLKVDVEDFSELEGTDYLDGVIDVFVDSEPLFSGDIIKINTNQNDEYYQIKAHPVGRRIADEIIDETIDSAPLRDIAAKIVDEYNDFDDRHSNLRGTADESTSNIEHLGQDVLRATADNATIQYSSVGSDADALKAVYVKAKTLSNITFEIITNNSSYSENLSGLTTSSYGDWVKIEPSGLNSESYDIKYTLDKDSVLYDWISLTEQTLQRDVVNISESTVDTGKNLFTVNDNNGFENLFGDEISDDLPARINNDRIELLQCTFLDEGENNAQIKRSGDFSNGEAAEFQGVGDFTEFSFSPDYRIPAGEWRVGAFTKLDNWDGTMAVLLDGKEQFSSTYSGTTAGLGLRVGGFPDTELKPSEFYTIRYECTAYNSGEFFVDYYYASDEGDRFNFDYEIDIPTSSDYDSSDDIVDFPQLYPKSVPLESKDTASSFNITKVQADTTFQRTNSNQSVQASLDSGNTYLPDDGSETNTQSVTVNSDIPASSVKVKLELARDPPDGGTPENSETPRFGYRGNYIDEVSVDIDTDSLEVLYDETLDDNRLSSLSSLVSGTNSAFRWEGNSCKIFEKGNNKTSVNLRKEEVDSSIDIEDIYDKCTVVGNGVDSGVITANNSPSFIDAKKEINDPDITTERKAKRRARNFLNDNSSIKYKGEITTLPTKAPLGDLLDGGIFNHGEDMFIESVRYGKRRSSITLGRNRNFSEQVIQIEKDTTSNTKRDI